MLRYFAVGLVAMVGTISVAQSVQGPVGARNFGNVSVCPRGQNSPKPCSRNSKLTYQVTETTTFGETKVVTQGTPGLDFTLGATNCTGTVAAGSSCSVTAMFAPLAPGVRMGAVELTDSVGNLLASTYVYGNGQGAIAAFNPGVVKQLPVNGYDGFGAMAVDSEKDLYFPANGGMAKFNLRTGAQTMVVTSGVPFAVGAAVDGAGNIFYTANSLFKIVAGTGVQTTVGTDLNAAAELHWTAEGISTLETIGIFR